MLIALTGPIGSGKTKVAKIFSELGANVIDSDSLGHAALEEKKEQIVREFGDVIVEGHVSREKLSGIVFDDPQMLRKLNSIMHPLVDEKIRGHVNDSRINIVEVPLLSKSGIVFDKVILVEADRETRICRLMKRGISEKDIKKRMEFEERPDRYDYIVKNGTSESLEKQVKKIWRDLDEGSDLSGQL